MNIREKIILDDTLTKILYVWIVGLAIVAGLSVWNAVIKIMEYIT